MAAWITSHYRHPVIDDLPWHIYRKNNTGKRDLALAVNDLVLFYENGEPAGTATAIRQQDGAETLHVPLRSGAKGIVLAGTIVEGTRRRSPADLVYDYGNLSAWKFITPCKLTMKGYISYAHICDAIGRKVPANQFGLYPLTADAASRLMQRLKSIV